MVSGMSGADFEALVPASATMIPQRVIAHSEDRLGLEFGDGANFAVTVQARGQSAGAGRVLGIPNIGVPVGGE